MGKKKVTDTQTQQQSQQQVQYAPWATDYYSQLALEKGDVNRQFVQQILSGLQTELTPEQKEQLRLAGTRAVDATYGNAQQELLRRAAATGSATGVPEAIGELARNRASQMAAARLQTEAAIPALNMQLRGMGAQLFQPIMAQAVPMVPVGQTMTGTATGHEVQKTSGGLLGAVLGGLTAGAMNLVAPGSGMVMSSFA
jgi:hypothetical protein